MVCICHLDKWKHSYLEGKSVNMCNLARVCVCGGAGAGGSLLAVASWLSLCHNMRVIVVAAVPLCDNGGFQECGREELGAPPTKTIR